METCDPIGLLFGGMQKLGPGSDADTRHILGLLPAREYSRVVDAGCGTGRQTLVLARDLGGFVHAIDSHQPFLDELKRRAIAADLAHLIHVHCMDMVDIPTAFRDIDLLWSEGAAYNIGFPNALATWRSTLASDGFLVVSELSWLKAQVPPEVREFFRSGYPDMRSVQENITMAQDSDYKVVATHLLPADAWVSGYYDLLLPRAKNLIDHQDDGVRQFAAETVQEIEIFGRSDGSYGYVFYVLQPA
jgi:trans-aconitate methyltransferase